MRAIRAEGEQVVLDRAAPEPTLAPGDVLIRPTRAALHADLHPAAARPLPAKGRVLGSAFVGVVLATGAAPEAARPSRLPKGKRVIAHASIPCRTCDLCKGGLGQHCRARQVLGRTRDGPLGDVIALPAGAIVPVPDTLDDDRAALVHAAAGAHHASTLVRVEGKTYVTVLGDTLLALLVAQLMAARNASVRVLGERPERLGLAIASGMVRPRGRIILGVAPPVSMLDLRAIVESEVELLGCTGYGGTLEPALDLLARRALHVEPLIARRINLDHAAGVLNTRGTDLDGVLVEY